MLQTTLPEAGLKSNVKMTEFISSSDGDEAVVNVSGGRIQQVDKF